jgi:phage baseplate assembly protein W
MSNVIVDYSLKEPVFKQNITFSDLAMPLKIDKLQRQYMMNLGIAPVTPQDDWVIQAIKEAINNIFTWLPGQRILSPTFGNLLYKFLSEQISDVTSKNIQGAISKMFEWEPRTQLKSVNVTPYPDDNEYRVVVSYYIPLLDKAIETEFTLTRIMET